MNSLHLPVIHPSFERLKHSGRLLHLAAATFILIHAVSHFQKDHPNSLYIICLLLIAVDILILILAGKNILLHLPKINLFFRFIEFLFFLGIGTLLLFEKTWIMGSIHLALSAAYIYLFWCERRSVTEEYVGIHHTGISIPELQEEKFLLWSKVNHIEARYDSITIDTSLHKTYHFTLRKNLVFEELDQIHEFCRHYLGN